MLLLSTVLVCLTGIDLFNIVSGITTNLALKKTSYVAVLDPTHPPANGVDGDLATAAVCIGREGWLVVDLGASYRVHNIEVSTRKSCCGEELSNFKVGLLKDFDARNFQRNTLCGAYSGETATNHAYSINCNQPFPLSRYVTLYVENLNPEKMSVAEFKVNGDNKGDYSYQYVGCYEASSKTQTNPVTSVNQCIHHCGTSSGGTTLMFAGLKNGRDCACLKNLPTLVPASNCPLNCSDDPHACGGTSYLSAYSMIEWMDGGKQVSTISNCLGGNPVQGGVCIGGCEPGWKGESCYIRDCSNSNGNCKHSCVPFMIAAVQLAECECLPGHDNRTFYFSDCAGLQISVGECEKKKPCNETTSTCRNTEGSFQCHCKPGYGNSTGICEDLNECEKNKPCDETTSTCRNTDASFECDCKLGFEKSSGICQDSDECTSAQHNCSRDNNEQCLNTFASYDCVCDEHSLRINGSCIAIQSEDPAVKIGYIVGGVIGCLLFFLFVVAVLLCCLKRRNEFKKNNIIRRLSTKSLDIIRIPRGERRRSQDNSEILFPGKSEKQTDIIIISSAYERLGEGERYETILGVSTSPYTDLGTTIQRTKGYKFMAHQGLVGGQNREDFWRMVMKNEVPVIMMLSRFQGATTDSRSLYWPSSNMQEHGAVRVLLEEVSTWPAYEMRRLLITDTENVKSLQVSHLCYLEWPDQGVPCNVASFLNFHHKARQLVQAEVEMRRSAYYEMNDPTVNVLVHCSVDSAKIETLVRVDNLLEIASQGNGHFLRCSDPGTPNNSRLENDESFCKKVLHYFAKLGHSTIFTEDSLKKFVSEANPLQIESLTNQVQFIKESEPKGNEQLRVENIDNGTVKAEYYPFIKESEPKGNEQLRVDNGRVTPEYYPGFSRPQAFKLHNIEDVVTSDILFEDLIADCSSVLVLGEEAKALLEQLLPIAGQVMETAGYRITLQNSHPTYQTNLLLEKKDQPRSINYVEPDCNLTIEYMTLANTLTNWYQHSKGRHSPSQKPLLILYCKKKRQECLWTLVRLHLLEMADKYGEVDVYQSVFHIHNSQPPPTPHFANQRLLLNIHSYRDLHVFALKLLEAEHLYDSIDETCD